MPQTQYLDGILENNLNIVYHMSEISKKYVLTVNNEKTLKSIMNKFNMIYHKDYYEEDYKEVFLNSFFKYKKLTEGYDEVTINGKYYE